MTDLALFWQFFLVVVVVGQKLERMYSQASLIIRLAKTARPVAVTGWRQIAKQ
jgi:hypothetical protein